MKTILERTALALCLCLLLAGCAGNSPAAPSPVPTAAASPTAEPTAEPTPESTAEPTAEPTTEPTAEPAKKDEPSAALSAEVQTMEPLLKAHILAQLNGLSFDREDPTYFWQTVAIAIDECGLDFYSAETFGSALVLSRGVIEEIASGLFEDGGTFFLEIPDSLSGEIVYNKDADAFSHQLSDGGFSVSLTSLESENGGTSVKITGEFFADAMPNSAITAFTAVLVENPREANSLFTLSVKELKLG